ncbi:MULTISPECIES: hypothetical protein [unclassified Planococcus (in: firmicutes)]|uniref:hypothetical protein n=1 Tax=unclassified Planococcus (in: firmicutes) TaxID=2662419 RepID=UPI000C34EC83|nr:MULTISPECIES: hypothetical protein [unclassified Planococcus (in: firmicutes)]AUD15066.1 hypothetical protein CW734_17045 [Planococcus sp. MB-3u-03]PKG46994.1 hypothetical protein CXF66_04075 [Planococcus sp. Urea-trap-24]PKG87877.1 hypothetical protein CXF91_18135 [Planococcus sp. Urea-3u-39]PKH39104.1 hypothetical protein CXF77_10555 [Planococcus sp. MB-3u-09]
MNKYHRSSLQLLIIVAITLILSVYWLNLEIGYGIIFLLITVGYTIYLNSNAAKKSKHEQ